MRSQQEPAFSIQGRSSRTPSAGQFQPIATSPKRGSRSLLGIVLPAVAGSSLWLVPTLWNPDGIFSLAPFVMVAAATILFTFIGAALLCSWWALLAVPAAWVFGAAFTSLVVSVILYGFGWLTDYFNLTIFWPLLGVSLLLGTIPILICASLGIFYGKWLRRYGL
jgi:hypothetical protein